MPAFPDAYPATDGHALVIPRKHVTSIYKLSATEQSAVWDLVAEVRDRLLTGLKPDGFNIGVTRCARSTRWHSVDHQG